MDLDALKQTKLPQDPYLAKLTQHYLVFAENEAAKYDWSSSAHFADKGLKTAYGKPISPEDPADWIDEPETLATLKMAREMLLRKMDGAYQSTKPDLLADAVFYYDCWVEEANEAWQEEDILRCRLAYEEAIRQLNQTSQAHTTDKYAKQIASDVPLSTSEILYFGWNQSALSTQAQVILKQVVGYLNSLSQAYEVVLHGHTDRSGDAGVNLELSHKRAETVKSALKMLGISSQHINVFAFGESDPKVATPDGQREPANRRVEIFIE